MITWEDWLCCKLSRRRWKSGQRLIFCRLPSLSNCLLRSGARKHGFHLTGRTRCFTASLCTISLRTATSPSNPPTFSLSPGSRRTAWCTWESRMLGNFFLQNPNDSNSLLDWLISDGPVTCHLSLSSVTWQQAKHRQIWILTFSNINLIFVKIKHEKKNNLLSVNNIHLYYSFMSWTWMEWSVWARLTSETYSLTTWRQ